MRYAIVLLVASFFLCFAVNVQAQQVSVGVSPASVVHPNLLPATSRNGTITVSRSGDLLSEGTIQFLTEGAAIKELLVVNHGQPALIQAGQQEIEIPYTVSIPEGKPLGTYEGTVTVQALVKGSTAQVVVVPGVKLAVRLGVTDKVESDLSVLIATIPDLAHADDPITVILRFQNEGNAADRADKVKLDIKNVNQVALKSLESNTLDPVDAFATQEKTAIFTPHGLSEGTYFAYVTVLKNAVPLHQDLLSFTVGPERLKTVQAGVLHSFKLPFNLPLSLVDIIALMLCLFGSLLIAVVILRFLQHKYNRRTKHQTHKPQL